MDKPSNVVISLFDYMSRAYDADQILFSYANGLAIKDSDSVPT